MTTRSDFSPQDYREARRMGIALEDGPDEHTRSYNHDGCVTRWMQERDARERAEREALDWREAANEWCNRAERARKRNRTLVWVTVLAVFVAGMAWWIRF
jgi:hypothetical protein